MLENLISETENTIKKLNIKNNYYKHNIIEKTEIGFNNGIEDWE